jgi:hypothetical protein
MRRAHTSSMAKTVLALSFGLSVVSMGGLSGCAAAGVGDPCVPEAVPSNGFTPSEVYVETSAVQCRTRVCVVYQLRGNPENIEEVPGSCTTGDCVTEDPIIPETLLAENNINRVFCSCRCRAGEGNPNLPLCACGGGFHCADEGYCVPHEADDQYCAADYEGNCPSTGCDLTTNRCN